MGLAEEIMGIESIAPEFELWHSVEPRDEEGAEIMALIMRMRAWFGGLV